MILFLLVLAVSLIPAIPTVHAQTTNISDVRYPKRATFDLERRTTDPPLLVEVTVSFSDAKAGYFLAVDVFDLENGDVVGGSGSASNGACESVYARCLIGIKAFSGVEYVQFLLAGYKPTMSMAIIAALYDEVKSLIYNSESDYEFTINMTATLSLSVIVPGSVAVTVDEITQPAGNVRLNLVPGTHALSLPGIVRLDNVTRLKFQHWSDGKNETDRSVSLIQGTFLTAIYVTQYWLEVASTHGNSTGSGWYDEGSGASFSVQSTTISMENVLGLLGGEWVFEGWYQRGELISPASTGTVAMLGSHFLTARWAPDLTLPLIFLAVAALALLAIVLVVRRRGSARVIRRTPKGRRGGSGAARRLRKT